MSKVKLFTFAVVVALLAISATDNPISSLFTGNGNCRISNAHAASLSFEPITQWQIYNDADYKLVLEYPVGWESKTTIFQKIPYKDATAIIKRQTFIGTEGLIDLDIWVANGLSLGEWLDWYGKTRSPLPTTELNAKVLGYPAVVFLEPGGTVDMLAAFFTDGKYVYRLWYTVMRNEIGLQVYQHMLNTIGLSDGFDKVTIPVDLPENFWDITETAVQTSGVISPLVSSCCGYYSSGNPFPCCTNKGNCTWWVYYNYGYVPFRGDAGTWWSQVPNYSDWSRGSQPKKNQENIAWWSKTSSPPYGHVAYASNYTGGSNITISEMLWCNSCGRTRTISITQPRGYIYEKYPPQP